MDISKQGYSEANTTGISMYLSFDSSISSAAYKTLEAMEATTNDLSIFSSNMEEDEETAGSSSDLHQNSTLEAVDSHIEYLKKTEKLKHLSPLRVLPKRVLQEFNAVCSTPTKEQLMRSVEILRGSNTENCVDLTKAFLDMEGKKSAKKVLPQKEEDNKENTVAHITEQDKLIPTNISNSAFKQMNMKLSTIAEVAATDIEMTDNSELTKNNNTTPKGHTKEAMELKSDKISTSAKIKRNSASKKKPICEPDLQTNRPSRIVNNAYKQMSLTTTNKPIDKEITESLPKILNKVLKFANDPKDKVDGKPNSTADKRKSIASIPKGRTSMLPAAVQAEKRPFSFNQRMSVLVKTTLNSPARKIARRSVAPIGQQTWKPIAQAMQSTKTRKSMLPIGKPISAENNIAVEPLTTKVVEPKITQTNRKSIYTEVNKQKTETQIKTELTKRRSMFPIEKQSLVTQTRKSIMPQNENKVKQPVTATAALPKPDTLFVCNVCGSKFRIKSLLDAHKRSHEDSPIFVKKSSTNAISSAGTGSAANTANQCKYCDKKFALLRALHIHLMQNCPKIPPSEKRKLEFTEMNHVEKAQLPAVFHTTNNNLQSNSLIASNGAMKCAVPLRSHSDVSSISVSSTDSSNEKKALADITIIANQAVAVVDGMAPPPSNIVKKTIAHAGVHRTPNKSIACHICKTSFKCIMDHIHHNMTVHFKPSNEKNLKITFEQNAE